MNKKIKDFAAQAMQYAVDQPTSVDKDTHLNNLFEKFAELIIKECIKICEHQATMQFDAYHFNLVEHDTSEVADQCAKEIKEYFGVE